MVAVDYVQALRDADSCSGGGFDFSNFIRNEYIMKSLSVSQPTLTTTGTTICGVLCRDGVILAADTRATAGETIVEKKADKLHRMADNIYCAGAGTSADLTHATNMISRQLELQKLTLNRGIRVGSAVALITEHLFKHMGYIGCALVMGGWDIKGGSLYMIYPHGSCDTLPFATMGSGSLAAMSVMENDFKDDMTMEEGKALCINAINAGITNDLGSGGQVDVVSISKTGVNHERKVLEPWPKTRAPKPVLFQTGTTPVLVEKIQELRGLISVQDNVTTTTVNMM